MGLVLVTSPATEPVSLGEVKDHLKVETTDDDALIAGYMLAAREYAEDFTRRAFIPQTWDYLIDGTWPTVKGRDGAKVRRIVLPKPPLRSVSSITYVDTAGVTQTLASDQYLVSVNRDEGTIAPAYGVTWPTVRDQMDAITVRFNCGYSSMGTVPARVRQAILLMVGSWYDNREDIITGTIVNQVPTGVEALLGPLRIFY